MSTPLQKIKELIPELPSKDIDFAKKFLAERDWESLKDLTFSSLQRFELALKKDSLPAKYTNLDIDKIRELALLCDEYYYLIFPDEIQEEEEYPEEDF
jgi:hypothetical protein